MAEPVLENVCKVTDSRPELPPEMFWKKHNFWLNMPASRQEWYQQAHTWLTGLTEVCAEAFQKAGEALAAQIQSGMQAIEVGLHVTMAKDPQEFCSLLGQYWQKSFDYLRPMTQTPMQAAYFARALGVHIAGGMKMASKEVYQKRLAICAGCEFFQNNHCLQCGCRLAGDVVAKARWTSETCPLGRWPQLE